MSRLQRMNYLKTNVNIHSLSLKLIYFTDVHCLLIYTPNLKYLNIQSKQSERYQIPLNKINIKLEQFLFHTEQRVGI